jgi:hypothetical protein
MDNLGLPVNLYMRILFFNTAAAAEYVIPTTGLRNTIKDAEDDVLHIGLLVQTNM